MKNDVKKVNEITTEMRINDLIYKIIDDELDDMIYDCDELDKEFEKTLLCKASFVGISKQRYAYSCCRWAA